MVDTAGKLTMSAWADMQQEWSKNTESKELTGILLWDFSAAFDTLYLCLWPQVAFFSIHITMFVH